MNATTGIDFRAIADGVDLRSLIVRELGEPGRGDKWKCPFHADTNPSMAISRDGRRFKCWSCGATGDALEWRMKRDGIGVADAARILDPSAVPDRSPRSASQAPRRESTPTPPPAPKRAERVAPWHDPEWQAAAEGLVIEAERMLWSVPGRPSLEWLRFRGLADHTIARFRLGFVPEWTQTAPVGVLADKNGERGIKAARGITMPWIAPGACHTGPVEGVPRWAGINVRKLMSDVFEPWTSADKCLAVIGSERGYAYPHCDLTPGVPCLIAEGEIDAMLAFQTIGHLVNVNTTGGAAVSPRPEALAEMAGCPLWLIATDHDDAGDEASANWRSRGGAKCRRMQLPYGNDIGEFVQAGGDLRSWLLTEVDRLGVNLE